MSILQLIPVFAQKRLCMILYSTFINSAGVFDLIGNIQIIKEYKLLHNFHGGCQGVRLDEKLFNIRNNMASECIRTILAGEEGKILLWGLFATFN